MEKLSDTKNSTDLRQMLESVANSKIKTVSIGIYGSLLQRPYYKPSDVYTHIAQINDLPDFVARRTEAEAAARAKVANGEATIYEIYDEL